MSQQGQAVLKKEEKTETFIEAVQRTENDYKMASGILFEAKDALANAQSRVKDAYDQAMRAQILYTSAKERHMMSVIQQQNEQLKTAANQQRPDNVDSGASVVFDMKGQPFNMQASQATPAAAPVSAPTQAPPQQAAQVSV